MQQATNHGNQNGSARFSGGRCRAMKPSKKNKPAMRVPKVGRHSSGQARVTFGGKVYYLGAFGSVEAQARFAELLKDWQANGGKPTERAPHAGQVVTVRHVLAQYRAWIESSGRYAKGGQPTSQRPIIERALASLEGFAGTRRMHELDEPLLMLWRDKLEENARLTRGGINRLVAVLLGALRWAKARGMMPAAAYASCAAMEPLKRGQVGERAEHGRKRRAVSLADVEKVAAAAHPTIAAMLRVQAMLGCRPGEVYAMRWQDIDKAPVVVNGVSMWTYRVADSVAKTAHHGCAISYPVPPAAQSILEQFKGLPMALVFKPTSGDCNRWGRDLYAREVAGACRRAGVAHFSPHEVRHGAVTRAAELHGVLAAQRLANHSSLQTTSRYVHADDQAAYAVAAAIG